MLDNYPDVLTVEQTAEVLSISKQKVYELLKAKIAGVPGICCEGSINGSRRSSDSSKRPLSRCLPL